MKKCSSCKKNKSLEDFYKSKANKDGLSGKCKDCSNSYRQAHSKKYYKNQQEYRSTPEGFISQLLYNTRTRANKKGFEYSLTKQDIIEMMEKSNMRCAVTGLEMNLNSFTRKKANPFKCSIDRIDSSKGYTVDNTRLVCWAVNQMKADRTDEEFKFWIDILHKTISSQASKEEGSTTIPQGSTLK